MATGGGFRIGMLMLGVREMDRALAFYRDVLGMSVQFSSAEFAFLDGGGVTLVLQLRTDAAPAAERWTETVLPVEDIDAAYAALSGRGVSFRIAPRVVTGDRLAADFRDPDGHVLSIFGPRRA